MKRETRWPAAWAGPLRLSALLVLAAGIFVGLTGCTPSPSGDVGRSDEPGLEQQVDEGSVYREPPIALASAKELRALIDAGKGSIVVLNFWATWCPPCVKEMPELARFYKDFANEDVVFLSFSADQHDTVEESVRPFVRSYEIPFPVYVMHLPNPDELDNELKLGWNGTLPTTYIFAPDGSVAQSQVGEVTYAYLAEAVESLRPTESGPSKGD